MNPAKQLDLLAANFTQLKVCLEFPGNQGDIKLGNQITANFTFLDLNRAEIKWRAKFVIRNVPMQEEFQFFNIDFTN